MGNFDEIDAMFQKMVLAKKPQKRNKKATTGEDPLLNLSREVIKAERTKAREKRGYSSGNGYEYVKIWNEDGSDYTYVTKARAKRKEYTGALPEEHQIIYFVDNTLKGEAKYARENLVMGFKKGVNLSLLTCEHCGTRGKWRLET
jgi:hypothetical protein